MQYLVNSREMKHYDTNTSTTFQIPSLVLMERAALEVVRVIKEERIKAENVFVVCGSGNNGGDGFAVARLLHLEGKKVRIVFSGEEKKATEETKKQLAILKAYGVAIEKEFPADETPDLLIDAVFGIGLSRNIEGEYAELLNQMNEVSAVKLALDIPSGVNASDGNVMGTAFRADYTVTFAYGKIGMYLWPGNELCGKICIRPIGIDEKSWLEKKPAVAAYTLQELEQIPARKSHSNKGTYGKVLLIAGSVNMAGAAIFAARAAYTMGCGLVRVYTPEENRQIIQQTVPEAILTTYSGKRVELQELIEAIQWADVIACGPGIGTGDVSKSIVKNVLKNAAVPVVLDADALNIAAEDTSLLQRPHTDLIVTPHLGEMSRLNGDIVSFIQTRLLETAEEFARQYNVVCVLKDEHSVVSIPYGQTYLNLSGNHGMATAGSGDVLTGILASLLAQGLHTEQAAPLGVFLHGLAADEILEETGSYGMLAEDIIKGLQKVLRKAERHEYEEKHVYKGMR